MQSPSHATSSFNLHDMKLELRMARELLREQSLTCSVTDGIRDRAPLALKEVLWMGCT